MIKKKKDADLEPYVLVSYSKSPSSGGGYTVPIGTPVTIDTSGYTDVHIFSIYPKPKVKPKKRGKKSDRQRKNI